MGILNGMETTLRNGDEILKLLEKKEQLIFDLLIPGVTRIITKNNLLDIIKSSLDTACFPLLSTYKSREVVTLDCKGLSTKDAVGMMESIAAKASKHPDLIVIVENIAGIWSDPHCDDPRYMAYLLGHSWKNEQIYFGDHHIDRTGMTILLTALPEHKEELEHRYKTDSYSWVDDFDAELDDLQKAMNDLQ